MYFNKNELVSLPAKSFRAGKIRVRVRLKEGFNYAKVYQHQNQQPIKKIQKKETEPGLFLNRLKKAILGFGYKAKNGLMLLILVAVVGFFLGFFKPAQALEINQKDSKNQIDLLNEIVQKSNKPYYKDVFGNVNGDKEILKLSFEGVVGGYQNQNFEPLKNISFQELAKIIHFGLLGQNYQNNSCFQFENVDFKNPFYGSILTLKCEGILVFDDNNLPQKEVDNIQYEKILRAVLEKFAGFEQSSKVDEKIKSLENYLVNQFKSNNSNNNQIFYPNRRLVAKNVYEIRRILGLDEIWSKFWQVEQNNQNLLSQFFANEVLGEVLGISEENVGKTDDKKNLELLPETPVKENLESKNQTQEPVQNQGKAESKTNNSSVNQSQNSGQNNKLNNKSNWLTYPKYGISAPLLYSTDDDLFGKKPNGEINYSDLREQSSTSSPIQKKLEKGVVHLGYTAKIGDVGNAFILGHSSNYAWVRSNYNEVFAPIMQKSQVGEEFFVYNQQGQELKFCVFETLQIKSTDTFKAFQTFGQKRVVTLQTTVMSWENGVYGPNQRWLTRGEMC